MGIKFYCPSCDKRLNVKSFLAGKTGFCPHCQAKVHIPTVSEAKRPASHDPAVSTILRQSDPQPAEATAAAKAVSVGVKEIASSSNGQSKPRVAAPTASSAVLPTAGRTAQPQNRVTPATGVSGEHASPAKPATTAVAVNAAADPSTMPPSQAAVPVAGATLSAAPASTSAAAVPSTPALAAPDPIAEAPHAVWYVRPPGGGQYGPAVGDVMRKWMVEGRVSADSLVWREGWPDWRKAGKVFPSLAPAAAPSAPPAAAPVAPLAGATGHISRSTRTPRKQNSTALAITAIVVLVLLSIALLIGLMKVLGVF
jgi:hypothetical protein